MYGLNIFILERECTHLERQAEQVDEALRVLVVIHLVLAERSKFFTVQRIGRFEADVCAVAFIKLHT